MYQDVTCNRSIYTILVQFQKMSLSKTGQFFPQLLYHIGEEVDLAQLVDKTELSLSSGGYGSAWNSNAVGAVT